MLMDINKLNRLRLLEAIANNNNSSQRDFSKRLNISLGLVNTFIKRLIKNGYCKVSTIPSRRMKYILTPKGVAEKSKLTYEYLLNSYMYYKDSQIKILSMFDELQRSNTHNVVFLGAGELAEIAYALISETSLRLVGVVDSDMVGKEFNGHTIIAPYDAKKLEFDKIICTEIPDKIKGADDMFKTISRKHVCYLL